MKVCGYSPDAGYYEEFRFPYLAVETLDSDPHYHVINRIRNFRTGLGLSQRQLASYAGCSRNAISAFENNKFQPSAEMILRLCSVLGVTFEQLFAVVWCD